MPFMFSFPNEYRAQTALMWKPNHGLLVYYFVAAFSFSCILLFILLHNLYFLFYFTAAI